MLAHVLGKTLLGGRRRQRCHPARSSRSGRKRRDREPFPWTDLPASWEHHLHGSDDVLNVLVGELGGDRQTHSLTADPVRVRKTLRLPAEGLLLTLASDLLCNTTFPLFRLARNTLGFSSAVRLTASSAPKAWSAPARTGVSPRRGRQPRTTKTARPHQPEGPSVCPFPELCAPAASLHSQRADVALGGRQAPERPPEHLRRFGGGEQTVFSLGRGRDGELIEREG